jgi:hypothetical protein
MGIPVDRDHFIAIPGTVITMARNDFHRGGGALDITEGTLVSDLAHFALLTQKSD